MLQKCLLFFLKLHLLIHTVSLGLDQTAGQRDHSSAVEEDFTQQVEGYQPAKNVVKPAYH